jgi:two-component system, cell cycle response regulator
MRISPLRRGGGEPGGSAAEGARVTDDDRTAVRRPNVDLSASAARPCVVVLSGCHVGLVRKLDAASLVIGRGGECDLSLQDDGLSRRHAKIVQYANGAVMVKDLDSTNGTFVNGRPVKTTALEDGDRIQLGSLTILKFSVQDDLEDQVQQRLYDAAMRDGLTKAYNRRFFEEELSRALAHAARHKSALSLLLLDLDRFKLINDSLGHPAGDAVLREVAARMSDAIRHEDVLCRVGGEEFAVVARSTTAASALVLADRLRARIAGAPIAYREHVLPVTTSVGIAQFDPARHATADLLLRSADDALYSAKGAGRNRACLDSSTALGT